MKKQKLIALKDIKSNVDEAYRTLRTNIQFSSLDEKIQTIVVTSAGPGEGKTTTAINLAMVIAQGGYKTIIVDCDQRKPRIHKIIKVSNQCGLSNVVIGEVELDDALYATEVDNLYVLTSGIKSPNPSELLASFRMKNFINSLKMKFEYIIIDTPPVLLVTDAQIVSQYADGCLIVVASGETQRESAIKAKELLNRVNAKILGIVLNKVSRRSKEYYYNY